MTNRISARRLILAALLPGAVLAFSSVSEAEFIFHVANYTYLHAESLPYDDRLISGDFNGDPYPDFVMSALVSITEGYLEVFLGNGDGTFQALEHVGTNEIWAIAVGDFDNNGLDDVLIKDWENSTWSDTAMCYLSIGNGEFASPIGVPGFLWQVAGGPRHMDVCDYDLDGNLDVALAAFDSIEVYLGAGDGTFSRSWGWESPFSGCISVESGDFDNDGIADLISLEDGVFYVFPGLGDGTFDGMSTSGGFSGPAWDADACCGDFNEDGWLDIAVTAGAGIGSWTIFVFLNQGDGTFPVNADYFYIDGLFYFDIFCEDLDLDGHLDLGVSIDQGDYALLLGGNGDGSFDASQPLWSVSGFGGLETARGDFDQDGDPDVAVTRQADSAQYPSGIYVIPNEIIPNGIEGGEPGMELPTLKPSCNPFSSSVTISCSGPSLPGQLMVYDITGRLIRSLSDREGESFLWDGRDGSGSDVPTGTYLIQGAIDGRATSIKVVRL